MCLHLVTPTNFLEVNYKKMIQILIYAAIVIFTAYQYSLNNARKKMQSKKTVSR